MSALAMLQERQHRQKVVDLVWWVKAWQQRRNFLSRRKVTSVFLFVLCDVILLHI